MHKRLGLAVMFLSFACGEDTTTRDPADSFSGSYSGTVSRIVTCTNPGPTHSGNLSMGFFKTGPTTLSGSIQLPIDVVGGHTSCGPAVAHINGSSAELAGEIPCQVVTKTVGSTLFSTQTSILDGYISFTNGTSSAYVTINSSAIITPGSSGAPCIASVQGSVQYTAD